jgi:hypothetical protein
MQSQQNIVTDTMSQCVADSAFCDNSCLPSDELGE